jgi:hypothetical protein
LPHHDQQASDDQNQTQHGRMLPSNMLLLNLIPLIDVTFSTPTPRLHSLTCEKGEQTAQAYENAWLRRLTSE